jgi:hypothetical protein
VYTIVWIEVPVLVRMSVIAPAPAAVSPVMFTWPAAVQLNVAPPTSESGIKFKASPLQIVCVAGTFVKTGVG